MTDKEIGREIAKAEGRCKRMVTLADSLKKGAKEDLAKELAVLRSCCGHRSVQPTPPLTPEKSTSKVKWKCCACGKVVDRPSTKQKTVKA
jgi:hypothetical protein